MNLNKSFLESPQFIIYSICIVIICLAGLKGYHYSNSYGNCDGRARLIGSRAMEAEKDPYFYKWNPNDGNYLLDPNDQK